MPRALHRLARFAFRRPWRVLAAWAVLLAVVGVLLATQPRVIASSFTLRGTPSQEVLDAVTAELPQAGGAQGTLVFTADDGGRVDTPARAAAIAEAARRAADTGYAVDLEAKLAAARVTVRETVTTQVEAKVAESLTPQLTALADGLDRAASATNTPAPAGNTSALAGLSTRARALTSAEPHARVAGATALFAEVEALRNRAGGAGLSPAELGMPAGSVPRTPPDAAVAAAVDKAVEPILRDLDRLTSGTTPQGHPLIVDGRTLATVRVSADGRTAMLPLQLSASLTDLPDNALPEVLRVTGQAAAEAGLSRSASASLTPSKPPLGGHELIGLGVAVLVLLLTLGSFVAAGLPVLTAVLGVAIGVGGAFAMSSHFVMTSSTPALGLMIGLAVGIDYALFILHKHRTLVTREGLAPAEAIGRAVGSAGSAVVFAGLTVITALLGLLTLDISFVTTMAITAAVTVLLAVAISVTALPALLGLVGVRIAGSLRSPRVAAPDPARPPAHHPVATRWIGVVTRRPLLTILAVSLGLGVLALGATGLRLGMPDGGVAAAGSPQRVNYDATSAAFGPGANAPLVVAVRHTDASSFDTAALLSRQAELAGIEGVSTVRFMGANEGRTLAIYQVTPQAGPTDRATEALVHRLRGTTLTGVAPLGVTGLTAINIDLSEVLAAAIPVYLGVVVVLSLIILLIVFRSLLIPLVATGGFLLSIAATMGLVSLAFGTEGFGWLAGVDRTGPILSFLPIMATGILYGLAMDYQVFLASSMREAHVHGAPAREAVATGFRHASRVVVAAAAIMVSVFAGFVLGDDTTIRQFGFALSTGILLDAFLIRMALMPAVLHLAGERAWWLPRWLDRMVPRVDIEGDRLDHRDPLGGSPAHQPVSIA
ncbi:MAG: MMPL family transporter [Actinomycetales bacterium]|nr:MMPL family transporter [Actinomycetales bacterium]